MYVTHVRQLWKPTLVWSVPQFADAAGRGVPLTPPPFSQLDMPKLRAKVTSDIMAQKVA